jgi:hypothetical protein
VAKAGDGEFCECKYPTDHKHEEIQKPFEPIKQELDAAKAQADIEIAAD